MKVIRQHCVTVAFILAVVQPLNAHAQVPLEKATTINGVLKLDLPDTISTSKEGNIHTYFGGDSLESYEITVFDTVLVKTDNEATFNIALKSFVAGKFAGEGFRPYKLLLTDTLIGSLPGLFIIGITNDTLQEARKFYCFVTIANSKAYWFFYYFKMPTLPTKKAQSFFSSIQFERYKIKEASLKIQSFKERKMAGKVWYISPELDSPLPLSESKKENRDISYPPPPPMPPINREWLVKSNKLASDYMLSRSSADKKYKNKAGIIVEGIVKEILGPDESGITIIILNGAPAKINVQCEVLSRYRIKSLKKGMKATFIARCKGINGNVILSDCIYVEKPTYE
jgi:hypothetical protein